MSEIGEMEERNMPHCWPNQLNKVYAPVGTVEIRLESNGMPVDNKHHAHTERLRGES